MRLFNQMMKFLVLTFIGKKNKIFKSIVNFVVVYMVNPFIGVKIPAKMFFHNKTMFINISTFIGIRMLRFKNLHIFALKKFLFFAKSKTNFFSMFFRKFYSFPCFTHSLFSFFRKLSPFKSFPITRTRTKSSFITEKIKKFKFAEFTRYFNWRNVSPCLFTIILLLLCLSSISCAHMNTETKTFYGWGSFKDQTMEIHSDHPFKDIFNFGALGG